MKRSESTVSLSPRNPIYNLHIHVPEDTVPGSQINGTITFDISGCELTDVQYVRLLLESVEYIVQNPTGQEVQEQSQVTAPKPKLKHARRFHLPFFHTRHKKHVPTTEKDHTITILDSLDIFKPTQPHETLYQGRHVYKFSIDLPMELKPTGATKTDTGDADLIMYRFHVHIAAGRFEEDGYCIIHVLPK
ncbi:hypothetical protein HDU76_012525 [Blyttiomyces sp. JEL0837]|nr:hypothetical protein HDU76_012525 [Blyttiomyces sp. JEL0837]